jgi:hypothetical protein
MDPSHAAEGRVGYDQRNDLPGTAARAGWRGGAIVMSKTYDFGDLGKPHEVIRELPIPDLSVQSELMDFMHWVDDQVRSVFVGSDVERKTPG